MRNRRHGTYTVDASGRDLADRIGAEASRLARQLEHCEHRGSGWVYVVSCTATGLAKVGWTGTDNLVKRMRHLQNVTATELRLLLIETGSDLAEEHAHRALKRWRHHGEWFDNRDNQVTRYFVGTWREPHAIRCPRCVAPIYGCDPPETYGCQQQRPRRREFMWRGKVRATRPTVDAPESRRA